MHLYMALCWGIARGGGASQLKGGEGTGRGRRATARGGGGGQVNTTNALYYMTEAGGIKSFSHQEDLPSNGLLGPI
jgi:hypothetical protein